MAKRRASAITLTFVVSEEDGQFVSECRELGTASCGDTVEEAFRNIQEAVELHLNTLEDLGELERFFRERKIRFDAAPGSRRISVAPNTYVANRAIFV